MSTLRRMANSLTAMAKMKKKKFSINKKTPYVQIHLIGSFIMLPGNPSPYIILFQTHFAYNDFKGLFKSSTNKLVHGFRSVYGEKIHKMCLLTFKNFHQTRDAIFSPLIRELKHSLGICFAYKILLYVHTFDYDILKYVSYKVKYNKKDHCVGKWVSKMYAKLTLPCLSGDVAFWIFALFRCGTHGNIKWTSLFV